MKVKIFALLILLMLLVNALLFLFGKIMQFAFWGVLIAIGIIAYKVIPKLREMEEEKSN